MFEAIHMTIDLIVRGVVFLMFITVMTGIGVLVRHEFFCVEDPNERPFPLPKPHPGPLPRRTTNHHSDLVFDQAS